MSERILYGWIIGLIFAGTVAYIWAGTDWELK